MKRIVLILSLILLVLTGCSSKFEASTTDNEEFNSYLDTLFIDTMQENIFNVYYTLNNYEDYGITKPDVTLGDLTYDETAISEIEKDKTALLSFDKKDLSSDQIVYYNNLLNYFDTTLSLAKYPEFDFFFRPSSGILSNLNTLFLEYKFTDQKRVDDYLILLQDLPRIIDDAIAASKVQAETGIFMQDTTIDATIAIIDRFISEIDDSAFIINFNDKINVVQFLDVSTKEEYIENNKSIVIQQIIPSYQMAKDALISLKGTSKYSGGLVNYPNGKNYYEALIQSKTSTTQSVDTIYKSLGKYLNNIIFNLQLIVSQTPELMEYMTTFNLESRSPETVIDEQIKNSSLYFDTVEDVDYVASYLNPAIADDNVSAYYLSPFIDGNDHNVIRINAMYNETNPLGMYYTLAHEGYPGHMYANIIYQNTDPHPISSIYNFLGYGEGWAMYAGMYAYDFLEYEYPTLAELFKCDMRANYVLMAITDIGVNYYGWDISQLSLELAKMGFNLSSQPDVIESLYDSVIDEPGIIVSYGVGLMEFENNLMSVKSELKDKLDIKDYHNMIVEKGPRSLDDLNEDVQIYIKENK